MRFGVVTVHFGDLPYFPYSGAINRAYCERHGYQFRVFTPRTAPEDRTVHWLKVRAVLDTLAHYDFILWMDPDAWVHDQNLRLEDQLVSRAGDAAEILIGTNRLNREVSWPRGGANTGVFLVRNTPLARHILEEWWHAPDHDPDTARTWPLDQAAFNRHVLPRWSPVGRVRLIDYHYLNGLDGEFIRHAMGQPLDTRVELLRAAHEQILGQVGSAL